MHDVKYITKVYTQIVSPQDEAEGRVPNTKAIRQMSILWRLRKRSFCMTYNSKKTGRQGFQQAFNSLCFKLLVREIVLNSNSDGVKFPSNFVFVTNILTVSRIYKLVNPPPDAMSFNVPPEIMAQC
jgi:hypothetical protein